MINDETLALFSSLKNKLNKEIENGKGKVPAHVADEIFSNVMGTRGKGTTFKFIMDFIGFKRVFNGGKKFYRPK